MTKLTFLFFFLIYANLSSCQQSVKQESKESKEVTPNTINYLLKDVGNISIPISMELQSGKYKEFSKEFQKKRSKIYKYEIPDQKVVFQNIGINEFDKNAMDSYTRIIITTEVGSNGDYEKLTTKFNLSQTELNEISSQMKKSIEAGMKIQGNKLLKWHGVHFVTVNGSTALKTSFVRRLNENKPVLVTIYQFQNYDRMHSITFSCQEESTMKWKDRFMRVIESFKITNIR